MINMFNLNLFKNIGFLLYLFVYLIFPYPAITQTLKVDFIRNLENTLNAKDLEFIRKNFRNEESQNIPKQKNKKIKKVEKPKNVLENKKDINLEKIQKQKNNRIKNLSKKRKFELQSYKIILILKDVDPKDPTEELSSILSNSEVNFEIEKIERILDSKNKTMNKN